MGFQDNGWKLDIVFVIDATNSMTPIMKQVKESALSLADEIKQRLDCAKAPIKSLRLRVIDYADYASEGVDAIRQTDFFVMPDEKDKFERAINDIDFKGRGRGGAKNGLEALYCAMSSDWEDLRVELGRHFIILWTNSYPLDFQERASCSGYPADDLPGNIEELGQVWHAGIQENITKLSPSKKRLVLYAPAGADSAGHSWDAVRSWEWAIGNYIEDSIGNYSTSLIDFMITEMLNSF